MRMLGNGADFWRVLLMNNFHMENLAVAPGPSPASMCWLPFVPCQMGFFKDLLAEGLHEPSFGNPRK